MNKLEETRFKINEIDKKMAELFEKRMLLAKDVANFKFSHNLPIFDRIREEENIKRNVLNLNNQDLQNYYIEFLTKIMDISKEYQKFLLEKNKNLHDDMLD